MLEQHQVSPGTPKHRKHAKAANAPSMSYAAALRSNLEDQQDVVETHQVERLVESGKHSQLEIDGDAVKVHEKLGDKDLVSGRRAGAGWDRSRIRFAPLNLPLKRRLQTLVVLLHTLTMVITMTVFWFVAAIPLTWPILIPYLLYCFLAPPANNGDLHRRSNFVRSSKVWSLFASYFPARLHRSQPLSPKRKYIFGYHPHGILSLGAFSAFGTEALGFSQLFPGITNTLLTLESNFRFPFYRDYALALGLASVSRRSCEALLSKGGNDGKGTGRAITIVIGGARESLDSLPGSLRLVIKRRRGFVKLAIRTGADLVPVIGFGENDLYDQAPPEKHPYIRKVQLLMKDILGWTLPVAHARGVFNYDVGMMPYRRPLNIVIGRPIAVIQNSNPDQKYVDEIHDQYIQELQRMWDDNKDLFVPDRLSELEIVD